MSGFSRLDGEEIFVISAKNHKKRKIRSRPKKGGGHTGFNFVFWYVKLIKLKAL